MKIWVDADACPNVIKEILYKASNRLQIEMILVANQYINTPKSKYIKFVKVGQGMDIADNYISNNLKYGDLVITADIPLASEVVNKKAFALNPRGTFYTKENIGEKLAMRNLMDELRGAGQVSGGPPAIGNKEKQTFANALDRFLTNNIR